MKSIVKCDQKNNLKLNFGSNNKIIGEEFINVDALDLENVDIVHDFNIFPYPLNDESAIDITAIELLEHLSPRITLKFLKECYRILQKGGILMIQVPACDKMMQFYVNNQIGDVMPHKPISTKEALKIQSETGTMVNPVRFEYAFTGACKHEYDYHLNFFTKEKLKELMDQLNFFEYEIYYDELQWKLILTAKK